MVGPCSKLISFHWISPVWKKWELGQSDLIRLIMVLATAGDGKLGQVDLINSWQGDSLFG